MNGLEPAHNAHKLSELNSNKSAAYIDTLFKNANKLMIKYFPGQIPCEQKNSITIGFELECSGQTRVRMAYRESSGLSVFVHQHNLCMLTSADTFNDDVDRMFALKFHSIIDHAFKCFAKHYNELDDDAKHVEKHFAFEIIELDQRPVFRFDSVTLCTVNDILFTFFEYTIKLFSSASQIEKKKAIDLYILCPPHFTIVDRLFLHDICDRLSVHAFHFVDKSFGLAANLLFANKIACPNCLVIEFSSGI
jgi:hypothetical protein